MCSNTSTKDKAKKSEVPIASSPWSCLDDAPHSLWTVHSAESDLFQEDANRPDIAYNKLLSRLEG